MAKRYLPQEFSRILVPKGFENIPLEVSGRQGRGKAVAWYHQTREEWFILIPLDADGYLDEQAVQEVLASL